MAIEIEDIKKALRSGKYSEMQSNIDTGDIENDSNNQFGLAVINAKQIKNADFFETMLNEYQMYKESRTGLENKIIVYKPKTVEPITDIKKYIKETTNPNQNHGGIYYCDDQKNVYRLSPDYQFNELVTQSLLSLCDNISDIQTYISSYAYSYADTYYDDKISELNENIFTVNTKISKLENKIVQLENQISYNSYTSYVNTYYDDKISELNKNIYTLNTNISTLNTKINKLENRILQLENQIDNSYTSYI